jgi:fibrillarin-like pre-rRNA processing protein
MKGSAYFGVFRKGRDLYTRNLVPGISVYGERLEQDESGGGEYRRWNPKRSKLSAVLHSKMKTFVFKKKMRVLYLGAATGTSLSHLSDIVMDGQIFAVEFSPISYRKLASLSEKRSNIIPILEDASQPSRYAPIVAGPVDVVWQDISQRDQVRILEKNCRQFCKPGTLVYYVLKARSIDSSGSFKKINKRVIVDLKKDFEILESIEISRYQRDHMVHVLKMK